MMDAAQLATKALAWLGIAPGSTTPDATIAPDVAAAVSSWVASLPITYQVEAWPNDVQLGAVMLTARLIRRRNSPAGIESFNAAGGTVYTRREDPDVARMLGLGDSARPQIG